MAANLRSGSEGPSGLNARSRSSSFAARAKSPLSEAIIPAFAISLLVLGFNLLADGLREVSLKD